MRILIVRHGDPDYSNDSLTERGHAEAELLAKKLVNEPIHAIWCSTMGRAVQTCEPTAKALGLQPIYRDWLREVRYPIAFPGMDKPRWFCWPPKIWTEYTDLTDGGSAWKENPILVESGMIDYLENVFHQLDGVISGYGYVRHGRYYDLLPNRKDTVLAFFCHQGLGTALISHITGLPLPLLWNVSMTPTTSVSTIIMDHYDPEEPVAIPRILSMGDTGHLYAGGMNVNWRGLHHEIIPEMKGMTGSN